MKTHLGWVGGAVFCQIKFQTDKKGESICDTHTCTHRGCVLHGSNFGLLMANISLTKGEKPCKHTGKPKSKRNNTSICSFGPQKIQHPTA